MGRYPTSFSFTGTLIPMPWKGSPNDSFFLCFFNVFKKSPSYFWWSNEEGTISSQSFWHLLERYLRTQQGFASPTISKAGKFVGRLGIWMMYFGSSSGTSLKNEIFKFYRKKLIIASNKQIDLPRIRPMFAFLAGQLRNEMLNNWSVDHQIQVLPSIQMGLSIS